MAEETKTILFYLLALAGLILSSILFTGRIEPLPLEPQAFTPASPTRLGGPIDVVLPVPPPLSFRANLIPPEVAGERLTISGVVYAADGETPLPDARVEVWQANPTDFYLSHAYPAPAFNLGGQMRTDAAGRYEFTTLKPSPFKVDQVYLPAQIHFQVSYQDHKPLFTRLFFADDSYLANIPAAPDLAIRLSERVGPTGPVWQGTFDVVLPISAR